MAINTVRTLAPFWYNLSTPLYPIRIPSMLQTKCIQLQKAAHSTLTYKLPATDPSEASASRHLFFKIAATPALARLPFSSIMRNAMLCAVFSYPLLWRPCFLFLRKVAGSRSLALNPDKNPVLRRALKPLIYNQFCAGVHRAEILRTRETNKRVGYSGVVLCYAKEMPITCDKQNRSANGITNTELDRWRKGTLETLDMIGDGDWIGIKFTGAGSVVTRALMLDQPPPPDFIAAVDEICTQAKAQNCRVWIDAEQQEFQQNINKWTVDLMRRYNKAGAVVVYTTLQAYLKSSKATLGNFLDLARGEGWTLAIKLVRGAYIDHEPRNLIHDTKEETDQCYNSIVRELLSGTSLARGSGNPSIRLILAGHNPESVELAWELIHDLNQKGELKLMPDFAQLQGMGDDLGCRFLQNCDILRKQGRSDAEIPKMYKCLTWGSIQECMQYLFRRMVENSGGSDRLRDGLSAYIGELTRRLTSRLKQIV